MPTLQDLCRVVDGQLKGAPDFEVTGVGSLEGAGPGDIAPIDSAQYLRLAQDSKAGAFLARRGLGEELGRPCILHDFPLLALNRVMEELGLVAGPRAPGVHPTAVVETKLDRSVTVGPCAVVQAGARVGARCVIHSHAVVESGAVLGEDCVLEPGVVIHDGAVLGNRVKIGAHAVISRQGFGFTAGPAGPARLHHIGRVVLEDDVHIGAGTAIDRARFDETRIGAMSALDNLVHIGHNCAIGKRTFVAAQTGLAGNAYVGNDCQIGGQAGINNRAGVGDNSLVAGKSGVMKAFGPNSDLMWYPARSRRKILRLLAKLMRA